MERSFTGEIRDGWTGQPLGVLERKRWFLKESTMSTTPVEWGRREVSRCLPIIHDCKGIPPPEVLPPRSLKTGLCRETQEPQDPNRLCSALPKQRVTGDGPWMTNRRQILLQSWWTSGVSYWEKSNKVLSRWDQVQFSFEVNQCNIFDTSKFGDCIL